jgi:hypothetical protein
VGTPEEHGVKRTPVLLAACALCAALAVLLALFARDVTRWPVTIRSDDVAAADPAHAGRVSWRVNEALPFSPARAALGIGDDAVYRRAAVAFRRAYTRDPDFERSTVGTNARIRAETALAREIRSDPDRRRASAASNLLGILALVDAAASTTGNAPLDRSVFEFQDAIRLDPSNEQAKANLEMLYQQTSLKASVRGRERLQRSAHAGASDSAAGHGY